MPTFAAKYQPLRFSEIVGQETVVNWCRHQVRDRDFQSVLLGGPTGTGKTTLALTYARAIFCQHLGADFSPCGTCDVCQKVTKASAGFPDFASIQCGERSRVDDIDWLQEIARVRPLFAERRVVFLDEVHCLSRRAFDSLLKLLTLNESWRPTFILATTRPEKVPLTVASRVKEFQLTLLCTEDSLRFVKNVVEREGLLAEPDALPFLVDYRGGYPRLLLRDLEQLASSGPITEAAVRRAFSLDYFDAFSAFSNAFIARDLPHLIASVDSWPLEPSRKFELIKRFLNFAYQKTVLGLDVTDRAVDVLCPETYEAIASTILATTLQTGLSATLVWDRLLEQLAATPVNNNWNLRRVTTSLYHAVLALPVKPSAATPLSVRPEKRKSVTRLALVGDPSCRGWMTREHVTRLYRIGSFLPHRYGVLFNMRLTLRPVVLGITDGYQAETLASELMHALRGKLKYRQPNALLHFVYTQEYSTAGHATRAAMHVPDEYLGEFAEWLRGRFDSSTSTNTTRLGVQVAARAAALAKQQAIAFHWSCIRVQMRGLDPHILERTSDGSMAPLVDLLNISERLRTPTGGLGLGQSLGRSESLGPTAMRLIATDGLAPLSALDDRAWRYLYSGWELSEHAAVQKELHRRQKEEAKLRHRYSGEDDLSRARLAEAIAALHASFPTDPRKRPRNWRGWWT